MNNNTREDLKAFVSAVTTLAISMSSVAGTYATNNILKAADKLMSQLDKDETILP